MQGKTLFSKDKIIRKIRKNITSTDTIPSFLYYICIVSIRPSPLNSATAKQPLFLCCFAVDTIYKIL